MANWTFDSLRPFADPFQVLAWIYTRSKHSVEVHCSYRVIHPGPQPASNDSFLGRGVHGLIMTAPASPGHRHLVGCRVEWGVLDETTNAGIRKHSALSNLAKPTFSSVDPRFKQIFSISLENNEHTLAA